MIVRILWFALRFAGYFSAILAWPLVRAICHFDKWFGRPIFDFLFVVYPGTLDQVRGYAPLWFRHIAPTISVIGIVRSKNGGMRGLVMTTPWTIEEIEDGKHQELAQEIRRIAEMIGVRSVALAGRLPGVLKKKGHALDTPFVAGDKGTVYTVIRSTEAAIESCGLKSPKIGILGFGFIGSVLAGALQERDFRDIIAVDPRITDDRSSGGVRFSRDPILLADRDVVVILTARGEQAETAIDHFKDGVVIVDDTHPQLPRRLARRIESRSGRVVKATLSMEGMSFFPRLPKWDAHWLPGCCVEAMVVVRSGSSVDQTEFNAMADQLGFQPILVTNKSDL